MYSEGISQTGSILDLGVEHKFLEKKGAWIAYKGEMIGQGREAAKRYLAENQNVLFEIRDSIMEKVQVSVGSVLAKNDEDTSS